MGGSSRARPSVGPPTERTSPWGVCSGESGEGWRKATRGASMGRLVPRVGRGGRIGGVHRRSPVRGRAGRGVYGRERERACPARARPLWAGSRSRWARATPEDPRMSGSGPVRASVFRSDRPRQIDRYIDFFGGAVPASCRWHRRRSGPGRGEHRSKGPVGPSLGHLVRPLY